MGQRVPNPKFQESTEVKYYGRFGYERLFAHFCSPSFNPAAISLSNPVVYSVQ